MAKKELSEMTNKERLEYIKECRKNTNLNNEQQELNVTKVEGSIEDYIASRRLTQWKEALNDIESRRR